jgi:hypothetical protein
LLLIYYYSLAISLPRNQSVTRKLLGLIILSIVLLTTSIADLAVPPYLTATVKAFFKLGVLREEFYKERI